MNTPQNDELFSLACIYEDSKEVVLQFPDSKKEDVDYEIVVKLDVSTRHKIQMQISTLCFNTCCSFDQLNFVLLCLLVPF